MASYRVYVCHNQTCQERGAAAAWQSFGRAIHRAGLDDQIDLIVAGCQGRCEWGPNVTVHPGATKYTGVDAAAAAEITAEHLAHDRIVAVYLLEAR